MTLRVRAVAAHSHRGRNLVANARKLRLIYANKRNTDEIDAENLARLSRLDPRLLYPVEHRGEGSQAHMAIIRSRRALIGGRTQL